MLLTLVNKFLLYTSGGRKEMRFKGGGEILWSIRNDSLPCLPCGLEKSWREIVIIIIILGKSKTGHEGGSSDFYAFIERNLTWLFVIMACDSDLWYAIFSFLLDWIRYFLFSNKNLIRMISRKESYPRDTHCMQQESDGESQTRRSRIEWRRVVK